MKAPLSISPAFQKAIFTSLLIICIVFPIDAPIALLMGIVLALTSGNPFLSLNKKATTWLLQISVVCLGFHVNLQHALLAGKDGFVFTLCSIAVTLVAGYITGKLLKIDKTTSYLISSGTAICGGSAIAAISPIVRANDQQISVALGTIFILNSIALFIFPWMGHLIGFTQQQFGTWCAIAIHDTSSVVGAASKYGAEALQVGTTIKLERALWIIPVSLLTAYFNKGGGAVKIPYFIFVFILAIIVSTYVPKGQIIYDYAYLFGKKGLVVTLFLIGSGLSLKTIRQVGWRPILQGMILWLLISSLSLVAIKGFV